MSLRGIWVLIKRTFSEWNDDRVPRLAAALAFYTVFSIAPVLVIAVAIAGSIFGKQRASNEVGYQLEALMGQPAAELVQQTLERAAAPGSGGRWAAVFGLVVLLYGATNVFAELQDSMNTIWEVEPKPGEMGWQILRNRLLSFVMVLGTAFLLLVSLLVSAVLAASGRYMSGDSGTMVWRIVNPVASLVIFTLIFAAIFKWLPDARIDWKDVWIGAVLTAVLFTGGKFLIGAYLGHSSISSVYGAAGSIAVLLIWIYYSAQILFIGAEFTQVWARRHGEPIVPSEIAEKRKPG